jgi:hypothetical protein
MDPQNEDLLYFCTNRSHRSLDDSVMNFHKRKRFYDEKTHPFLGNCGRLLTPTRDLSAQCSVLSAQLSLGHLGGKAHGSQNAGKTRTHVEP